MRSPALPQILVTGGAGYVGAALVPSLLHRGHRVRVLDLYLFGTAPLEAVRSHPYLEEIRADIRDVAAVRRALAGTDAVIHLACISNDPSCELDPALTRSINFDAFEPVVRLAREAGVRRFIFASSSSVYGISDRPQVCEDAPLKPITLYNRYKGECEAVLFRHQAEDFTTVAIRPATICGRSPRQRLDLTVNLLTTHAVERGVITVFGGAQQRPNLHLRDMLSVYELMLDAPSERIGGQAFNVGFENCSVAEIAATVKTVVETEMPEHRPLRIATTTSDDPRSYHICSDKLFRRLGFRPRRRITEAVRELVAAFRAHEIPDALTDSRYHNVQRMQQIGLT